MAVMMRFLLGGLNGLLGPMKVYQSRHYIKCLDLYPSISQFNYLYNLFFTTPSLIGLFFGNF
jgi:hypothetical protein